MKNCRRPLLALTITCGLFALSLRLSADWEKKLTIYPVGMDLPRAQAADEDETEEEEETNVQNYRTEIGTSQKTWKENGVINAQYRFINFNKDKLSVSFAMSAGDYNRYLAGYGYSDAEIAALRDWREKAHQHAWNQAIVAGGKIAAEKAIKEVALEYDTKLRRLLLQRGFALRTGNVVECNIPGIVKRNIPLLQPLAMSFQKLALNGGYGAEETVGAVLSMVQTAIRYKIPPMLEGGTHTGGLLPPARALLSGWGDCDTKTSVAASILGNWSGMRLVGIAVPGHYLMAIRRIPAKGDMFVRYEGLEYVLIEPAGPAWLEPGTVGGNTAALLEGSAGYAVEPFF
jgi:hypothetical protein